MRKLLDGITVLDLTKLLPGPFCTMILADLGAEVIKVEMPDQGDLTRYVPPYLEGMGSLFFSLNRNKKSITLNLKDDDGKKILQELIKQSDVLVEGFKPETSQKLGLNYENIKKINPSIIQLSITGFGQVSPYRNRPGHDLNYLGYTGLLSYDPRKIPLLQVADVGGGSLWGVIGILAALWKRSQDPEKKGMYIDLSMVDGAFSWLNSMSGTAYWVNKGFEDLELPLSGVNHWYRTYETKDGKYITFACLEPWFWEKFCIALEKEEWLDKHQVKGEEREKMHRELEAFFKTKTRDEWVELLADFTCVGPVYTFEEAFNDQHVKVRNLVSTLEGTSDLKVIKTPFIVNPNKEEADVKPPELGEHTDEILKQLGFSEEDIKRLRDKGTI